MGNVQDRLGLPPFLQLAQLDQAAHQRACRVIQKYQLLIMGEHYSLNDQLDSNQGSKISNSILFFCPTTYIVWRGLHCNALFNVHHLQYTSRSDSGSPCMWLSSHRHTPAMETSDVMLVYKVNRCLARYSPRATTTNRPANRAPKKPAWPGPN